MLSTNISVILLFGANVMFSFTAAILLPNSSNQALTTNGISTLNAAITADNKRLETALAAFVPVNATCHQIANQTSKACSNCVKDKCTKRGEKVCSNFLTDTIQFFNDDVPQFFENTVPATFVDLGNGAVNLGQSAVSDVVNFGKDIPSGISGAVNDVGGVAINIGKGLENVGNTIVNSVINPALNLGNDFGDLLKNLGKSIFGRKKRSIKSLLLKKRQRRSADSPSIPTSAPNCDQIQNNASYYCLYYSDSRRCSDCAFDANKQCPGWTQAVIDVEAASNARKWISVATDSTYSVQSVDYNPTNFDQTGKVSGVKVKVYLFGKTHSFTLTQSVNLFDVATTGALIASNVIDVARADA